MRKLSASLLVIFTTLLLTSCQQEVGQIIEQASHCKIDKGYYYGGSGGINDSVIFTYTNGKLSRAEGNDEYVLYSYNGDNISIRKFYEKPGNIFYSVDSIAYDNSNRITRLTSWEYPSSFGFDTVNLVYIFTYQGAILNKVEETEIIPNTSSSITNYLFTNNAAGNTERIQIADEFNNVYDSISYSYNTNPNYFKIVHPHFFLFDPFFQLHVGLVPHFPYFYSRNNVIKYTIYGNVDYNIVYGLDSLSNVTSVDMGGFEYMKYKYSCQ
ncbi:MAG TPA: hypothetical protein VIV35_02980 [Chitinophagaceae bacterium]